MTITKKPKLRRSTGGTNTGTGVTFIFNRIKLLKIALNGRWAEITSCFATCWDAMHLEVLPLNLMAEYLPMIQYLQT